MTRLLLAALATLALGTPVAAAAPISAVATVNRDVITVGDPIVLSVIVQADPGYQVVDPGVPRVFGDFEVLETLAAQQDPSRGGTTRITFHYRITSFRLGDLVIPPFAVAFSGPDGQRGALSTNEVPLRVVSVIGVGEQPSDIKPLLPQLALPGAEMARVARLAVLALAGCVLAFVALLVIGRLRRTRSAEVVQGSARPVREALEELVRIADLRLPEQGRLQEHYELLAVSLRRYVRARFGLSASHRTPRELRGDLERAGADRAQIAIIYQVLHEAEIARYRHLAPYPSHAREAVRMALAVMRKAAADEEYQTASAAQLP